MSHTEAICHRRSAAGHAYRGNDGRAHAGEGFVGRAVVEGAINRWNIDNAGDTGVVVLPARWETSATAEIGGAPQVVINRQLVETSDVLIGVFGIRLGSPTATDVSGTAEELQQFVDTGRPATAYFSKRARGRVRH